MASDLLLIGIKVQVDLRDHDAKQYRVEHGADEHGTKAADAISNKRVCKKNHLRNLSRAFCHCSILSPVDEDVNGDH
jgi:hypothetical protein